MLADMDSSAARAPRAPYQRVKSHLKAQLAAGRWRPGQLMPSEAELVAQFGVSRMTVNRALRELQTEGLVERVQGVGTFAAQPHRLSSTLTIRDLHEEIEARGHRHHAEVHVKREERAPRALAEQLGLAPGGRVFHTLIVHFDDGVPSIIRGPDFDLVRDGCELQCVLHHVAEGDDQQVAVTPYVRHRPGDLL